VAHPLSSSASSAFPPHQHQHEQQHQSQQPSLQPPRSSSFSQQQPQPFHHHQALFQPPAAQPHPERHQPQPPASAAEYFASRQPRDSRLYVHTITILPSSIRADFPYPQDWTAAHDVRPQDWGTFIGFLIPETDSARDAKRLSDERKKEIDDALKQWNEGFFGPRGVIIRLDDPLAPSRTSSTRDAGMSSSSSIALGGPSSTNHGAGSIYLGGSFNDSFNGSSASVNTGGPWSTHSNTPPPLQQPPPPPHQMPQGFTSNPLSPQQQMQQPEEPAATTKAGRLAQKLRKVAAETTLTSDRIGYSDLFTVDSHKIKIGKLVFDGKGMHLDDYYEDRPGGMGQQPYPYPQHQGGYGLHPPTSYGAPHSYQYQPHGYQPSPSPNQSFQPPPPGSMHHSSSFHSDHLNMMPSPQQQQSPYGGPPSWRPGSSYGGGPSSSQGPPPNSPPHNSPPQMMPSNRPPGEKSSLGSGF
jgi:hypothetical protein